MSDDDQQPSDIPVAVAPAAADVLAVVSTVPAPLVEPQRLEEGLRYLQRRIPGFTQLSVQEKRTHSRAASLDAAFIESGLQAACAWTDTKTVIKRSGEELRQEEEEIRRWDQVIRELRAITEGIEAANMKRKHRLGTAILQIYSILGAFFGRHANPKDAYLRPYYEEMKRAYMRTQQFRKRKKQTTPASE